MTNKKPSEAQRKVLQRLNQGGRLLHTRGRDPHVYYQFRAVYDRVNLSTFVALLQAGWLVTSGQRYPFTYYVLSDAGYEAIKEQTP